MSADIIEASLRKAEQSASDTSGRVQLRWPVESAAQIAAAGVPPVEWDIEGLVERHSGPVNIFGPPESLKSWIALHAACCMVTGEKFLGQYPVRPRPQALYVNLDAGAREFRRRVSRLGPGIDELWITSPDSFDAEMLHGALSEYPEAWVSIDCFADIYKADPRAEPGQAMREFVRGLRNLFEANGQNGFVVDHARRLRPGDPASSERYYGSGQKKAAFRQMWYVERLRRQDEPGGTARAKIICEKLAEAEHFRAFVAEFAWTPDRFQATWGGLLDDVTAEADAAMRHRDLIEPYMADAKAGVTLAFLADKTGLSKRQLLAALKTPGIVTIGKGKSTRYVLSETLTGSALDDSTDLPSNRSIHSHPLGDGNETNESAEYHDTFPPENESGNEPAYDEGFSEPEDGNEHGNESLTTVGCGIGNAARDG